VAVPVEIATRWGDTLLDVAHVDDFTLVDVVLVHRGVLVAPPAGRIGCIDYAATVVEPPVRNLPAPRGDHRWIPYVAGALLVHLALWRVATLESPIEPPPKPTPRPPTIARITAEPSRAYTPPDDRARDRVDDDKSQGQGQAMQGPEGAAGARSPRKHGHIAIKNTGEPAQLTKAEAVARARKAGVLGSAQVLLESYATLGGADRVTSAFDAMDVTALTRGADTASGAFGLGRMSDGAGGGGTTYGTIGTGRTGSFSNGTTHGHGWGGSRAPVTITPNWRAYDGRTYDGSYYTGGPRRLRWHTPYVTICPKTASPCEVTGAIDAAVVRRYVKRNIQKLSYCYERELLDMPRLRGQINLSFAINGEGTVEVTRSSGFDDSITACVSDVIARIDMPRGATFVEYVLRFDVPPS
jgi:hypothetical protein